MNKTINYFKLLIEGKDIIEVIGEVKSLKQLKGPNYMGNFTKAKSDLSRFITDYHSIENTKSAKYLTLINNILIIFFFLIILFLSFFVLYFKKDLQIPASVVATCIIILTIRKW